MLVEKAQEFPALFLVNERKKDAKGYGSNHEGLIPGFLYRISTAECLHHGGAAWAAFSTFYAIIISNR